MEPVNVYLTYCAIKAHFGEGDYDFHKFGGKSKVSRGSFYKRSDRSFFVRLSKKYTEYSDIKNFLVANLQNRTCSFKSLHRTPNSLRHDFRVSQTRFKPT